MALSQKVVFTNGVPSGEADASIIDIVNPTVPLADKQGNVLRVAAYVLLSRLLLG